MRKFFLAVVVMGLATIASAASFEGVVKYELTTDEGKKIPVEYELKEPSIRATFHSEEGKPATMIFDTANDTTIMLMPDRKMAMKSHLKAPAAKGKKDDEVSKAEFKNTGRKETVAGHECTVYTFKGKDSEGEVCNAEGMGKFYFANSRWQKNENSVVWDEAKKKGIFPLRVESTSLKSGKKMTMVATSIVKKSVPASEFQVPADYKVVEGFGGAPSAGGSAAAPATGPTNDFAKKLMSASPEERQKMIEQMRQQYGDAAPKK